MNGAAHDVNPATFSNEKKESRAGRLNEPKMRVENFKSQAEICNCLGLTFEIRYPRKFKQKYQTFDYI